MAKNSRRYLDLRGLTYWFKRDIPLKIRAHFSGKTAYLENLRTSDLKEAMERRDTLEGLVEQTFKDALAGRSSGSPDDIAKIEARAEAWGLELAQRTHIALERRRVPASALSHGEDGDLLDEEVDVFSVFEDTAEQVERQHGPAARQRFVAVAHGAVEVDKYVDAYLKEARLAPKTTEERRNLIKRFAEWAKARSLTLPDIKRAIAGEYFTEHISSMHASTAKKHHGSVKLYWDYLIARGLYHGKDNPWDGQKMPQRGRRVEREQQEEERPFTDDEMKALLYSRYPDGMKAAFKDQLHDAIRISALSGMRLAEVVTLLVEECIADDGQGQWFDIRQGKTRAAARKVPVHPSLEEIVERRIRGKNPDDWLFHELAGKRNAGDIFGKRFAQYRKKLKVDDVHAGQRRSLVNFHSFRRWFVTQAEQAGQQESIISLVVGHEQGRDFTLRKYSAGISDDQKRACVQAVSLPEGSASKAD